jgi:thiol-disulfide isomerase/thioredoxin
MQTETVRLHFGAPLKRPTNGLVVLMRRQVVVLFTVWGFAAISTAQETGPATAAWSQLEALNAAEHEKVPIGTNAVEFNAARNKALHDAAAAFILKFPSDVHAPQAMLWKLETSDFPDRSDQRLALLHQNDLEAQSLNKNSVLPANLRYEAQHTVLLQWLDNSDLITTRDQAAAIENRIEELLAKNPAEPEAITFQLAKADLLLRFDYQKGIAFLDELTKSPDAQLSNAAAVRLTKAEIVGKPIDLQFTSVDGSPVDLAALRGDVVLIDFWASWCPDCIRETPNLKAVYQKYRDKGLAVIGISLDKDEQAMSNYIAKKLIPWRQYFDGKGWANDFAVKFGVHSIPEVWLIDRQGKVVTTGIAADQLDAEVARLIGGNDQLSRN